jgi:hypothetical protein
MAASTPVICAAVKKNIDPVAVGAATETFGVRIETVELVLSSRTVVVNGFRIRTHDKLLLRLQPVSIHPAMAATGEVELTIENLPN